jgi:hypothetical protein
MTFRFLFEPRDLWIGVYLDTRRRIYVLPLPCVGVVIHYGLCYEPLPVKVK